MKIIQVLSNFSGTGQDAYLISLYHELVRQGHDVKMFYFSGKDIFSFDVSTINLFHKDFCQETYDEMNDADIVLINGLPHKKEDKSYRDAYLDMLQYHVTTRKVLFIHSHIYNSWSRANYTERLVTKDFLCSIDKICSFAPESLVMKKFAITMGKDEFDKRFIHLFHPYVFNKNLWVDAKNKQKKISYLGRLVKLKDPERLIDMRNELWDNGWQVEMRGVVRSIGALAFRNLCFNFDENGKMTKEPSDATVFMTGIKKAEYGLDKKDKVCTDLNSTDRKIFVFGRYQLADGLKAMSMQSFGVDFYNLKSHAYGDAVEYAIYDIVNCGTIPVLDKEMAKHVHLYKDGKSTNRTLYSENAGIFVASDLSNVNEVVQQMNELFNDKSKYDTFRENCFNVYKELANPNWIIKRLISDIMK